MRFILCLLLAACGGEVIVEPTPEPVDPADTATQPEDDEPAPGLEPECRVDEDCHLDCCTVSCSCRAVPITVLVEDCEPMNCGVVPPTPMRAACIEHSCATIEIE